jgi:hypothetical protein
MPALFIFISKKKQVSVGTRLNGFTGDRSEVLIYFPGYG